MSRLRRVLVDHFRCWHVTLVPEVLGMAAIEGQPASPCEIGKTGIQKA